MKSQHVLITGFIFFTLGLLGQDRTNKAVDSLYKEDQFYIGTVYNLIGKKPKGLTQNGFSLGFHLGYVKDMPLNKKRTIAIGLGLGYATNSYIQNMLIRKNDLGDFTYSILNDEDFNKNKFSDHVIELPIEFRWRTSTVESYKFWRIYTGLKLGYVFASRSKFKSDQGNLRYNGIKDYNNFQYGATISLGYNTWNIFMYYGLNTVFTDKAKIDNDVIDMNTIKIGLQFYIL